MSMELEKIIKFLTNIRNQLLESLNIKESIIQQLKADFEETKSIIREIDTFINANSIISSDKLIDTEEFLKLKSKKKIENVDVTKKVYFKDTNNLLAMIKYNGSQMEIYFPNPDILKLTSSEERYLCYIIEPLLKIKNAEPNLNLKIENKNEKNFITKLLIQNIYNIESAEEIFKSIENLKEINF